MTFFKKFIILLHFIVSINSQKLVLIKWISTDSLPNQENYLKLEISSPCNDDSKCCAWYKLNENKEIDEEGKNFGQKYLYEVTKTHCNLLMVEYDTEKQIDFYKAINVNQRNVNSDFHYALALFKSLNVKKEKINDVTYNFTCTLELDVPDGTQDPELYEGLQSAMYSTISLETGESNSAMSKSITRNSPRVGAVSNKDPGAIKHPNQFIKITKPKQTTNKRNTQFINTIKVSLDPVTIYTTSRSQSNKYFYCTTKLKDEMDQKIAIENTVSVPVGESLLRPVPRGIASRKLINLHLVTLLYAIFLLL